MGRSFRHRGLERLFTLGDHRGVPSDFVPRLERMLDRLDGAMKPEDMNLPGFRFHRLKEQRRGSYAVSVSGNWRPTLMAARLGKLLDTAPESWLTLDLWEIDQDPGRLAAVQPIRVVN